MVNVLCLYSSEGQVELGVLIFHPLSIALIDQGFPSWLRAAICLDTSNLVFDAPIVYFVRSSPSGTYLLLVVHSLILPQ
jgi:hypothetical protein